MKRLILSVLLAGIVGASAIAGTVIPGGKHKVTNNKVARDADKGMKKTEKGVRHGAYDATHNKATKKMKVNQGNREYSNQKDL